MEGGQGGGLEGREMKAETTHSMVQREKLALSVRWGTS